MTILHTLDNIVGVDFETYYAADYSLSLPKYNTSGYVRDPQFKIQGVAIKEGRKKAQWYTGKDVVRKLKSIDWSRKAMLAHNAQFDGFIMSEILKLFPSFFYDTLSMTRALHNDMSRASLDTVAKLYGIGEKSRTYLVNTKGVRDLPPQDLKHLGEGAIIDIDLAWEIFRRQIEVFPEEETRLVDLTVKMFTDPVLGVDIELATAALEREMEARAKAIKRSKVPEKDLTSNAKFAAHLERLGVEPPTKISFKTGYTNFALAKTDQEFLDLLEHEDMRVVRLAEGRLAAKSTIEETRARRLIAAGEDGKRLPILLNYAAAKTFRWSGGNKMNPQNFPRAQYVGKVKVEHSDDLRRSIIAPPGHVLVVADSSQIELRVNNKLAGNEAKLEIIRKYDRKEGPDPYRVLAASIYSLAIEAINDTQRFVGKVGELGLGFQMSGKKLQTTLALGTMGPAIDLPLALCNKIVKVYRATNKPIEDQWAACEQILRNMFAGDEGEYADLISYDDRTIWLPNGLGMNYPGLEPKYERNRQGDMIQRGWTYIAHGIEKKIYGGLLTENLVQAIARIIVGQQMLAIADKYRVVMMTHDEVVACVPKRQAEKALEYMIKCMRTPPTFWPDIPLNAEGGFDVCYSK
jgi:hypothetical protein